MPEKLGYLDCCNEPVLETIKNLRKCSHATESIRRCRHCGQAWYYALYESCHQGESLDCIVWCCRLTPEEAAQLANVPRQKRLVILDQKAGFLCDDEGVRKEVRQPMTGQV